MNTSPSEALIEELIDTVKEGVAKRGYYFLGERLLKKLLAGKATRIARLQRLQDFAGACGTRFDANDKLTTVIFRDAEFHKPALTPITL